MLLNQQENKVKNIAILLAAGRGTRFLGDVPKQYCKILGKEILTWTIESFLKNKKIDLVYVVINKDDIDLYNKATNHLKIMPAIIGGKTRQESVANAIVEIKKYKEANILIHDICRPLVSQEIISKIIEELEIYDCVFPAIPVNDTVKRIKDDKIVTENRENLYYVQTPQGVKLSSYVEILKSSDLSSVTDDATLFEKFGKKVKMIEGSIKNIKITNPQDLSVAEGIMSANFRLRTGIGFDAHKYIKSDINHVIIGGVKIGHDLSIEAHSDGDVLIHAIVDAILGAIGAGDIGEHFPPTDIKWKNADSKKFLCFAADLVKQKRGEIINVDCTVICQSPKLSPYKLEMANQISSCLGIDKNCVNVKATTTEQLGFTGRREGIAAQAVVNVMMEK